MTGSDHDSCPIVPCLRYRDAAAAIEWLCNAFGFTRHVVFEGPDGGIAHAELRFGDGFIMLGSEKEDDFRWTSALSQPAITQSIYLVVEDVDAHHAAATAAGATIARPLTDTDYGSREYSARDLEGHLWHFGTYRPGGSA